jgi:hypothetical protein
LQNDRPNRTGLLQFCLQQFSTSEAWVLTWNQIAWARLDEKTLAERSFQHQHAILSC